MAESEGVPYPEAIFTPVLPAEAKPVRNKVCIGFQAKPFSNYSELTGVDVKIGGEGGD